MSAGPYIYSSAVVATSQDNFSSPAPALSPVRLPAQPHMSTDTQQPRRPPAAKFRRDFSENLTIFFVDFSAIFGHGTLISMPRWLVHRVSYDTHLDLPFAYTCWLPAWTRGTFTAPSPHTSLIPCPHPSTARNLPHNIRHARPSHHTKRVPHCVGAIFLCV